ncbi:hypothetical protein D3C74_436300 [compost metagenome]
MPVHPKRGHRVQPAMVPHCTRTIVVTGCAELADPRFSSFPEVRTRNHGTHPRTCGIEAWIPDTVTASSVRSGDAHAVPPVHAVVLAISQS